MSVRTVCSLIVLVLITGLAVFVLNRPDDQDRGGGAPSHDQSSAPTALRLPEKLSEPPPGVTVKKSREEASSLPHPSSLPQEPVTSEKPTGQQPLITVADGRLSVQVENRPLKWVLEEIARQSGVFISAEDVGGNRVSMQLQDFPLDQGLQHILKDQDAFFFYGTAAEGGYGNASLRAVWVYAKGKGRSILPVPREVWASTQEVAQSLADPDPDERARAIEVLVERKGKQALDTVLQALRDQDDKVRYRALYKALNAGLALPADSLQDLVRHDPSPIVRFLALGAIAEKPGADSQKIRAIAELALNDPSLPVQNQAQEILDQLELANQPPDPSQPSQAQGGPGSQ